MVGAGLGHDVVFLARCQGAPVTMIAAPAFSPAPGQSCQSHCPARPLCLDPGFSTGLPGVWVSLVSTLMLLFGTSLPPLLGGDAPSLELSLAAFEGQVPFLQ